jgi:hypothetical protein
MTKLLCRLFGHSWQTTHTNRYMIPTREVCRCGAVREWHGGIEGGWRLWNRLRVRVVEADPETAAAMPPMEE